MTTVPKNTEGGRTITFAGLMPNREPGHCALTFENAGRGLMTVQLGPYPGDTD